MLRRGDFLMIHNQYQQGMYLKDIATQLGVSPKTVSRAIKRGGAPSGRPGRPKKSVLDPYKNQIDQMLADDIWNAKVIWTCLREQGFTGCQALVRRYVQPKRPLRTAKGVVRYETPPGKQMQSDWAEQIVQVGGVRTKVFVCLNTLGYSRSMHAWAALSLDASHTYEAMIRAFEYFGGVPAEVLVDNQKAVVISHRLDEGPVFNVRYLDMAHYYGFVPKACRPARPQTKGKVERCVSYLKQNFFARYRAFDSLDQLNELLESWLKTQAEPRYHGTTRQQVSTAFQEEQPFLHPLPTQRLDTAYIESRKVSKDAYIEVRGNRYSVPGALVGQTVTVYIGLDQSLRVADAHHHWVAHHMLKSAHQGWSTDAQHHRPLWQNSSHTVQARSLATYEEALSWN